MFSLLYILLFYPWVFFYWLCSRSHFNWISLSGILKDLLNIITWGSWTEQMGVDGHFPLKRYDLVEVMGVRKPGLMMGDLKATGKRCQLFQKVACHESMFQLVFCLQDEQKIAVQSLLKRQFVVRAVEGVIDQNELADWGSESDNILQARTEIFLATAQ